MPWNWQLPKWPDFHYNPDRIAEKEKKFLLAVGSSSAFLKKIEEEDHWQFIVEILSSEGEQSSRIEGEILDRESLQSSIKRHFGLSPPQKSKHLYRARLDCTNFDSARHSQIEAKRSERARPLLNSKASKEDRFGKVAASQNSHNLSGRGIKEAGMAELLYDVYHSYDKRLTHDMLWAWHSKLFKSTTGNYREHEEPMQIVGRRLDVSQVFFEAPPSNRIYSEMQRYIEWFNSSKPAHSILGRAAIAHLYFENIHPFEDGNGRIGRAIVEKSLSQGVGRPILIAVSKVLEKRRKEYYQALETCNRTLEATAWVEFFADVILQAQEESLNLLNFIIEKSKLLSKLAGKLNERQEKALLRMFHEGPKGFQGGLSAENYIAITGAARATATRDLTELVELGALFKTGELRHTRYWLNIGPAN